MIPVNGLKVMEKSSVAAVTRTQTRLVIFRREPVTSVMSRERAICFFFFFFSFVAAKSKISFLPPTRRYIKWIKRRVCDNTNAAGKTVINEHLKVKSTRNLHK